MGSQAATCILNEPHVKETNNQIAGPRAEANVDQTVARRGIYYGWVILPLVMLAMVASSPGQTFGVSIFNEPIRQSLGLSHTQMAAAYTLGTLLGAIPIMYIGVLMDRHGIRRTTLGVLTVLCLACLLTSAAQNWLMLAIGFFFLRMLGPGALSLLSGSALPFWFERRLGFVEGLRSVGHAASMATIPIVNLWLVNEFGWRGAYALLGCSIWLVLFPLYLVLFRNRPEEVGQLIDDGRIGDGTTSLRSATGSDAFRSGEEVAESIDRSTVLRQPISLQQRHDFTLAQSLRTYSFWTAALGSSMFGLVHTALFFSMIPIYQERGLTERDAATTLMVFAVSLALMQLIGGALADRMRAQPLLAIGLAGLSLGVGILYLASDPLWAIASGLVMGMTLGIFSGAIQPLWARYFGRQHLGKIRGVLMTMNIALSSVGPLIAGTARDLQGDFDLAMWMFIVLPIPLALMSCFASPPKPPQPSRAVLGLGSER
jgi:MFS transporter, OFA family, oxalate/formate antiporter